MNKIIKKIDNKLLFIIPKIIKYCIHPSKFCDYTQFQLSKIHPHAGVDRGVFDEAPLGYIKFDGSNWDKKPGVLFTNLLEFKALKDHYTGKLNWKKSRFAVRNVNYIKKNNSVRGFANHNLYLLKREKQIDRLFNSILKNGIYPNTIVCPKNKVKDNITVVLTKNNELYFNNRGHHRLSIAKILNLKEIPIKIVLAKSEKKLKEFYKHNS